MNNDNKQLLRDKIALAIHKQHCMNVTWRDDHCETDIQPNEYADADAVMVALEPLIAEHDADIKAHSSALNDIFMVTAGVLSDNDYTNWPIRARDAFLVISDLTHVLTKHDQRIVEQTESGPPPNIDPDDDWIKYANDEELQD